MSRLQGILAAGGLTGMVIASSAALGASGMLKQQSANSTTPEPTTEQTTQPEPTATPKVVVVHRPATLSARGQQYQTQIEAANQTIIQLQQQLAAQQGAAAGGGGGGGGNGGGGGSSSGESESGN